MPCPKFRDVDVSGEDDLTPGDHIYFPTDRKLPAAVGLPVCHHGIYIGNGEVIDFGREEINGVLVQHPVKNTLTTFAPGDKIKKMKKRIYTSKIHPTDLTIAYARALCSGENKFVYDVLQLNCEHFCTYVKTGTAGSAQADKAFRLFGDVANTVGGVFTEFGVNSRSSGSVSTALGGMSKSLGRYVAGKANSSGSAGN